MSYSPSWTNGDDQGRVEAGVHTVCLSDPLEINDAINRRLQLTYQGSQGVPPKFSSGAYVRPSPIATDTSPYYNLRYALSQKVLHAPPYGFGGVPPTPSSLEWLWPLADGDQNKVIVNDYTGVDPGEVGLFAKLNGTSNWTDPALTPGETDVRAVHFNELRQAVECISRGRWKMPIYFSAGIFSLMPDSPWATEAIANNGTEELRSIGFALISVGESTVSGLKDVTVRSSSKIEIWTDWDCTVGIYHCLRPINWYDNRPTWNKYQPPSAWSSPGGIGGGDSTSIGSVSAVEDEWVSFSGGGLTSALQAMVDGAQQNFLVRRVDSADSWTVDVLGRLTIEFDLDTPPN